MAEKKTGREEKGDTEVQERLDKPKMYKVMLLNDNYTSMEFVVGVLMGIFRHSQAAATRIMLSIHRNGVGVACVVSRDVAETRVDQVHEAAKEAGYPLQALMEPE